LPHEQLHDRLFSDGQGASPDSSCRADGDFPFFISSPRKFCEDEETQNFVDRTLGSTFLEFIFPQVFLEAVFCSSKGGALRRFVLDFANDGIAFRDSSYLFALTLLFADVNFIDSLDARCVV
jgi:hypothetical protein